MAEVPAATFEAPLLYEPPAAVEAPPPVETAAAGAEADKPRSAAPRDELVAERVGLGEGAAVQVGEEAARGGGLVQRR